MKLSIITPYYNTLEYTKRLAEVLEPQLNEDIEWIIVDDGTNEKELDKLKARVIHLEENSGGASKPRNIGIDNAKGKYIGFIDSDDMVTEDYTKEILKRIKQNKDIVYLSWYGYGREHIITVKPLKWNCAVWCRVYKKELIGNIRFDENVRIAEDYIFNSMINPKSSCCVKKIIYQYNNGRKGSILNG